MVCLGPSFVPRAVETSWRPGIFFDPAKFSWSGYSRRWRGLMFTEDGAVTTARGALAALEREAPLFVRPDEDSKAFDGAVFDDADALRTALGATDLATPVVRGGVRAVDAEWRFFVVDGEVVDASEYRRAGSPSLFRGAPPRALELAEAAVARWRPSSVFCLDVASSGDHFGVVEVNCLNAARFYAADARVVLAAVRASVSRHRS